MKVTLKKLVLHNFKGAADLTVDFADRTTIAGANATGKTRVFDAFTWLLFGKDSEDRKDFNIKTLNFLNEPLHRVDYSVSGVLSVDGRDETFERIYREKWVKKRGEEDQEFAGHETLYFINGVPQKMSEYQARVDSICREDLFKLLTNPMYFNNLPWAARRELLFEVAGKISDADVIGENHELMEFLDHLAGKSVKEFRTEMAFKKKKLNEVLQQIPSRTDEVVRAIQPDPDYAKVQTDIDKKVARIFQIDNLIASEAEKARLANHENEQKQSRIYELRRKINEIYATDKANAENAGFDLRQKKQRLEIGIKNLQSDTEGTRHRIENLKAQIAALVSENNGLRDDWTKVNESTLIFSDDEFICPACKRPFETDDIEAKKGEMTQRFNKSKTDKLEAITNIGKKNAAEVAEMTNEVVRLNVQVTANNQAIEKHRAELAEIVIPETPEIPLNPQITVLQDEIKTLEGQIKNIARADNSELLREKSELSGAIDQLKKSMNIKEQNDRLRERAAELAREQKELSQQIADLEKLEFQAEAYTKLKTYLTENKVNSLFKTVKFKMFNGLINGGSEETCETLINGVPYQDANNAARINSGIDIINVLSEHYQVHAPIFIDNSEAVNEILESDSQMVKLYVTTDKELKIKHN